MTATQQTVFRGHCHERPPVLKDHIFLSEGPTLGVIEPVTKDYLSWGTNVQQGGLSRQGLLYLVYSVSWSCFASWVSRTYSTFCSGLTVTSYQDWSDSVRMWLVGLWMWITWSASCRRVVSSTFLVLKISAQSLLLQTLKKWDTHVGKFQISV